MGTYDIRFPWSAIAACGGILPGSDGTGASWWADSPFPIKRLRGWLGRLLGAAASFAVLVGLILTVYASDDLYNSFKVSNAYYIPSVFNELGFPYCFCHQFTTYPVDRPEGFSRAEAESWETGDVYGPR